MKKRILSSLLALVMCLSAAIYIVPVQTSLTAYAAQTVSAPTASVDSGTHLCSGSLKITLSCKTDGAEIHYIVGKKDYVYKKAFYIKKNADIKVYAIKDGIKSKTVSYEYKLAPKVTPSVEASIYSSAQQVKLTCKAPKAKLYYTTDGSKPTKKSAVFPVQGIKISETTKLRVLAVKSGWKSYEYEYDYVIIDSSKSVLNDYESKWGYNSLDDAGKKAYIQIVNAIKKGTEITVSEEKAEAVDYKAIGELVYLENPQFFWYRGICQTTMHSSGGERTITYTPTLSSSSENAKITKKMKAAVKDIVAKALKTNDLKERAKILHDWLLENTYYSYEYSEAYGPLLYGTGLCEAYSKAYSYLCQSAGIVTYNVYGTGHGEGHMWTLVCIDGEWYHVDATFDDQNPISHEYFLIGSDYICGDHTYAGDLKAPLPLTFDAEKVEREYQKWVKEIIDNYNNGVNVTRFYTDFDVVGMLLVRISDLYYDLSKEGINKRIYYMYYNNWIEIDLR